MKIPPLLVLGPLVVAGLALFPTAAHGAEPTCQGRAATIASDAVTITGTEGPDVISAGATTRTITALGGDDVVCLFSGATLDAGAGADRVVATASPGGVGGQTSVALGAGDDTYTGSEGDDWVAGLGGADPLDSAGTDTISTGGGADRVRTGVPGVPNADVVDLGAGDDDVQAVLPPGSSARLAPGPAGDLDILTLRGSGPVGSLDVDLGGSVAVDGAARAAIAGFAWVVVEAEGAARTAVRGTGADDRIIVAGGTGRVDVAPARVTTSSPCATPTGARAAAWTWGAVATCSMWSHPAQFGSTWRTAGSSRGPGSRPP